MQPVRVVKMKLPQLHLTIVFLLATFSASAQQFLNGSFEITNYTSCRPGLSNSGLTAHVPYLVAFGVDQNQGIDFLTDSCGNGSAQDGQFFLGLPMGPHYTMPPMFGLKLSSPMLAGNSYTISFYYKAADKFTNYNKLLVGLSNIHNQFGHVVQTIEEFPEEWKRYEFQFVAPEDGLYITLRFKIGIITKVLLDNFLVACPTDVNLGADTLLCDFSKESLLLQTEGWFEEYHWQDLSTFPTYTVDQPGTYWVTVRRDACVLRDTIIVTEHPYLCRCNVFVPTAFTPNQDGFNDEIKPVAACEMTFYEFAIFNRWGQVVFRSNNPQQSWDGYIGGKHASAGVYAWALKYQNTYEDFARFEGGGLTLIR